MAQTDLKVQIKFQAVGDKKLADAFTRAANAQKKLKLTTEKLEKAQDKLNKQGLLSVRNNRLLSNSFATLRSKMLLASFAFTLISGTIGKFIQKSAEFEKVKTRLNAMFGSVERGTQAFNTFNKIAATTPFTLQDVVEAGATLKAFGADAEGLIKPVSDLAAFMGTTATEAAAALGRAFAGGAGAADILRERGILQLVKDSQGITDLTKITLPEFRAALEKTITDPSVGVAGATDKLSKTLSGLFSNLADSFTRLMAAIGDIAAGSKFRAGVEGLTTLFGKMASALKEINKTDIEKIAELREKLGIEVPDTKRQEEENALAVRIKQLSEQVTTGRTLTNVNQDLSAAYQDLLNKIIEYNDTEAGIGKSVAFNKMSTAERLVKTLEKEKLLYEELTQASLEYSRASSPFAGDVVPFIFREETIAELSQELDKGVVGLSARIPAKIFLPEQLLLPEETEELNKKFKQLLETGEAQLFQLREEMFSNHLNNLLSSLQSNLDARKNAELQALKDTDAYRKASSEERENMEKDALKKFQKQQKVLFRLTQLNEIAQVVMATQRNIAEISLLLTRLKGAEKYYMGTGQFALAANARAQMAGLASQIGFSKAAAAAQIGVISAQQAPAFARGGSFVTNGEQFIKVGDNAGGRERVDITPISSPAFGDAGGGNGITVNIMGNVIGTQEFVRDNLLPEIENSIRRNLA